MAAVFDLLEDAFPEARRELFVAQTSTTRRFGLATPAWRSFDGDPRETRVQTMSDRYSIRVAGDAELPALLEIHQAAIAGRRAIEHAESLGGRCAGRPRTCRGAPLAAVDPGIRTRHAPDDGPRARR